MPATTKTVEFVVFFSLTLDFVLVKSFKTRVALKQVYYWLRDYCEEIFSYNSDLENFLAVICGVISDNSAVVILDYGTEPVPGNLHLLDAPNHNRS